MNKTILVLRHEFWRHFKRRSFLFAILGIPLIMLFVSGGIILFFSGKAKEPVGILDRSGLLLEPTAYTAVEEDSMRFIIYSDETAVRNALSQKEIQAYFILPQDYLQTGRVTLYHTGDSFNEIAGAVADYIRASLLAGADQQLLQRFHENDLDITFISLADPNNQKSELGFVFSLVVGFIFLIAIFATSGLLLQAIIDEKENRTMEILITSLKPSQLMIGKVLGLVGLGFIQIGVWIGLIFIGLSIARANVAQFPDIVIPPSAILLALAWFIPYYVLLAALISGIGISVTAVGEGQQMVGIVTILSMFPFYFSWLIISNPHSPLSTIFSLIPFSSPLTMLIRSQITTVPIWQYILSWLMLAGTAALALILVSRIFHLGMLRYGKKVTWHEIRRQLRQAK